MAGKAAISALEDHIGYWLRFVSNHVSHAFIRKLEARGVTAAEWVVLRELFEAPGANPSHLADRLGMTRGAISKLVERLRRKALVERTSPGGDRRYQALMLTEAARALVPALSRLADENDREFFGHLDLERKDDLVSLLRDVVRRHGWKDLPID
jgi:DNA-binding MarR family transcriptional regulator